MRTSCFDTDFVSQMKLTALPLIYCFDDAKQICQNLMNNLFPLPYILDRKFHMNCSDVLTESARGEVEALTTLKQDHFDAVVFPEGFSADKNL